MNKCKLLSFSPFNDAYFHLLGIFTMWEGEERDRLIMQPHEKTAALE